MLRFLQSVLGFVIVFSTIVGGMIAAGVCHEMLTPDLEIFYAIWLWVGLIPFCWLACRILGTERVDHPVASYLAFLPILLILGVLFQMLGARSWSSPMHEVAFIAEIHVAIYLVSQVDKAVSWWSTRSTE